MTTSFQIELKVRDYECDIQGIVNNSVYLNYLEHARHEFLIAKGLDFAELASQGINLVVTRTEIDYKSSLKSGNRFFVESIYQPVSKVRFQFEQKIFRRDDMQLMVKALVTGASINNQGRPIKYPDLEKLL